MFILLFIVLLIPFLVIIQVPSWHRYVAHLNRTWTKLFYRFTFMPLEVQMSMQIENDGTYLFCPNHTSYLDIAIMGGTPTDFMFGNIMMIPK